MQTTIPQSLSKGACFAGHKVDLIARRMAGRAQTAALDFGCGAGLCLWLLEQRFPEATLYGYGVSCESVDVARARAGSARLTSAMERLPAGGFDVILASRGFHHIPPEDPKIALIEGERG